MFSSVDPNSGYNIASGVAIFAAILTLLALIGLWYFGSKKDNDTQIAIEFSRSEAAKANAEAAKASVELVKARENTKLIELDLQNAIKESRLQEEKVQGLKLQVEQEAIKRAKAESQLLTLKRKINWRFLNTELFSNTFKKYTYNSEEIEIVFNVNDLESQAFANRIADALNKAETNVKIPEGKRATDGWPFSMEHGGGYTTDSNFRGLNILISDENENPYKDEKSTLYALNKAFESCGYSPLFIGGYEQIRPSKGTIRIIIDSRL